MRPSGSLEWAAANADRFMAEYMGGIENAIKQHETENERKTREAG